MIYLWTIYRLIYIFNWKCADNCSYAGRYIFYLLRQFRNHEDLPGPSSTEKIKNQVLKKSSNNTPNGCNKTHNASEMDECYVLKCTGKMYESCLSCLKHFVASTVIIKIIDSNFFKSTSWIPSSSSSSSSASSSSLSSSNLMNKRKFGEIIGIVGHIREITTRSKTVKKVSSVQSEILWRFRTNYKLKKSEIIAQFSSIFTCVFGKSELLGK